ncbi:hypothetical protein EYZ11_000194 [Aspergillus tanneri]|uniref:Uncharacterized protein n=1 Tax=Aspergillus tanneri TaxID=1220188 RepID=A0A4V3UQU2_9EURO|nr:uncharacterized protein ATNIH1004_006425 [Aspergillus tanneri]KAA8647728.1 hypothetical protein ATNIH1004_006425 [Aspergillus tanneri]THD00301.1 hypothetical protein EYZ11_000194 [Aspergillus tanneri]
MALDIGGGLGEPENLGLREKEVEIGFGPCQAGLGGLSLAEREDQRRLPADKSSTFKSHLNTLTAFEGVVVAPQKRDPCI